MKKTGIWALIVLVSVLTGFRQDGLDKILTDGATVEKLAEGFLFTEGPTADSEGNVYFTDQPNDRIMVWSVSDKLNTFLQPSGRSNGLAFDNNGILWACADEKNEIWSADRSRNITKYPFMFSEKLMNGPNDLWIDSKGGIYFTDPFYKRPWWSHTGQPQEIQGVYYISPDKKEIKRIAADLKQPNGIVGSEDNKYLYVADIGDSKTYRYEITGEGIITNKMLFCGMGSDGMTIDSEGNIYLTGNGVSVFNKSGEKIGNIPVPEPWTANVCFGGKDLKNLYITASKGLYRISLKVRGTRG